VVAVFNFTPVLRGGYRVGLPAGGRWRELLNSDARAYGGGGAGNLGGVEAEPVPWHGRPASAALTIPPLAAVFLAPG
jgi:1,4-alpha-glucan branching enzyme